MLQHVCILNQCAAARRGAAARRRGTARGGEASPLGDFLFSKLKKNILKNLKIGLKCQNFMHGAVGYDYAWAVHSSVELWGQVVLATPNKYGSSSCISSKAILYNFKWEIPLVQVFLQKQF